MSLPDLTRQQVMNLFFYDSSTGELHALDRSTGRPIPGSNARGSKRGNNNAKYIQIDKHWYRVAAIVWLIEKDQWIGQRHIDYADGNPWNTHIDNLIVNADWHKDRKNSYRARVSVDGKVIDIGRFNNRFEMEQAVRTFRQEQTDELPDWLKPAVETPKRMQSAPVVTPVPAKEEPKPLTKKEFELVLKKQAEHSNDDLLDPDMAALAGDLRRQFLSNADAATQRIAYWGHVEQPWPR